MRNDLSESTLHFGKKIEKQARAWLEAGNRNLVLIHENYRWKGGELDLIFEDRSQPRSPELVIVEVRARQSGSWIDGLESVTFPKQLRLSRTIRHFLARYRGNCQSLRFDILAWDGRVWSHYSNIRLPEV